MMESEIKTVAHRIFADLAKYIAFVGIEGKVAAVEVIEQHLHALLNTPETEDFDRAVPLEAAHQVHRWGSEHDAGKQPEDWFWLLGYLAGKALASAKAGNMEKAKHHCISSAAALRNWHAHLRSGKSVMRPGTANHALACDDDRPVADPNKVKEMAEKLFRISRSTVFQQGRVVAEMQKELTDFALDQQRGAYDDEAQHSENSLPPCAE